MFLSSDVDACNRTTLARLSELFSKWTEPSLSTHSIQIANEPAMKVVVQLHELDAGSADVLVRNECKARKSSASFARVADEDVRAPSN